MFLLVVLADLFYVSCLLHSHFCSVQLTFLNIFSLIIQIAADFNLTVSC